MILGLAFVESLVLFAWVLFGLHRCVSNDARAQIESRLLPWSGRLFLSTKALTAHFPTATPKMGILID